MAKIDDDMRKLLQLVADGRLPQGNTRTIDEARDRFWLECIDGVWQLSEAGRDALANA